MIANIGLSNLQQQAQRMRFGNFEVIAMLSTGASRTLFLARHTRTGETALLTVSDATIVTPDRISRFAQAMSQAGMIRHRNIAPMLEADVSDHQPYFAASHGGKHTLRQWLASGKGKRGNALPLAHALEMTQSLAVAAQYAHDHGLLLGNLTPDTVLIGPDGQPQLSELGFAQALATAGAPSAQANAAARGYLAPECATGRAITAVSDVFALGALLHELALGRAPSQADASGAHLLQDGETTPALTAVINKALAHDANERYASPFEFERAIVAISRSVGFKQTLRRTKRLATAAVCAVALSAAAWWGNAQVQAGVITLPDLGPYVTQATSTLEGVVSRIRNPELVVPTVRESEVAAPARAPERPESASLDERPALNSGEDVPRTVIPAQAAEVPSAVQPAIIDGDAREELVVDLPAASVAPAAEPALVTQPPPQPTIPAVTPPARSAPQTSRAAPAQAPVSKKAVVTRPSRAQAATTGPTQRRSAQRRVDASAVAGSGSLQMTVLHTGADRWGRPSEWIAGNRNVCAFIDSPNDAGGERLWRFFAQVTLQNTGSGELRVAPGALSVRSRDNRVMPACLPGGLTLQAGESRTVWIRTFFEGDKPAPYRIQAQGAGRAACVQALNGSTNFGQSALKFRLVACR
jgi:serine/threonine-protein kinase